MDSAQSNAATRALERLGTGVSRVVEWGSGKLAAAWATGGSTEGENGQRKLSAAHLSAVRKLFLGPGAGLAALGLHSVIGDDGPVFKTTAAEHKLVMPSTCTYDHYKTAGTCAIKNTVLDTLIGADRLNFHMRFGRGASPHEEGGMYGALAVSGSFVDFLRTPTECSVDSDCSSLGTGLKCHDLTSLYDDNVFETHQSGYEWLLLRDGDFWGNKLGQCMGRSDLKTEVREFVHTVLAGRPLSQFLSAKSDTIKFCAPDVDEVERSVRNNIDAFIDVLPPTETTQMVNGASQKWWSLSHMEADSTPQLGFPGEKSSSTAATETVEVMLSMEGYTVDTFDNEARAAVVTSFAAQAGVLRGQVRIVSVSTSRRLDSRGLAVNGVNVQLRVEGAESSDKSAIEEIKPSAIMNDVGRIQSAFIPPAENAAEAQSVMSAFLLDKGFSSAEIDEAVSAMSAEIVTDNEQAATKKAAIAETEAANAAPAPALPGDDGIPDATNAASCPYGQNVGMAACMVAAVASFVIAF